MYTNCTDCIVYTVCNVECIVIGQIVQFTPCVMYTNCTDCIVRFTGGAH